MQIITREFVLEDALALQAQGLSPVMSRLFAARKIQQAQDIGGELADLIPPEQLLGAKAMAERLADAISQQQRILVVGDYDCDGATATAVAIKAIRRMGGEVDFLVPNRFEFGYGLSPEIVQVASQQKPDWIITVDNGIASIEGVKLANQLDIKVLITDHHLPADELPAAEVIVNPNQPDCRFPSKNLAGVGVIFYVMLMLRQILRQRGVFDENTQPNLSDLLDLVALGTVADLVKLDRNNRILVAHGLRRIRSGKACCGIRALFQAAARDIYHASAQDLGFSIGPRINAAGRLQDIELGIRCLLADDPVEALKLASTLNDINQQRREIESEIKFSAESLLEDMDISQRMTVCLFDETWHHGVIGIVASRIKEATHRPVIVFASDEHGLMRGSGRSIAGLHLRDALDLVSKADNQLIVKFGGHAMAAGLSIRPEGYAKFCAIFEAVVSSLIDAEAIQQRIEVDADLQANEMNLELAQMIEQQVWGQTFPFPSFVANFNVVQQRILGEKHLKLVVSPQAAPHVLFDAIFFNQAQLLANEVRLVYQLQVNRFNGNETVQLMVLHELPLQQADAIA